MIIYYPMAKTVDKSNNEITLTTYTGFTDREEALKQFDIWSDAYLYDLEDCKIDWYDDEQRGSYKVHRKYLIVLPMTKSEVTE